MDTDQHDPWFEDDVEDDGGIQIDLYDITASPNDFNLVTLGSFIDRGAVRIPGFQRFRGACLRRDRLHLDLIDEEGSGAFHPQAEPAGREVVGVPVRGQLAVHVAPEMPVAAEQPQPQPA